MGSPEVDPQYVLRSARHTASLVCSALVLALLLSVFGTATPAGATPASDESELLTLMNQSRTGAGLPPMVSDGALAATSRSWSSIMAGQNRLFHDSNLAAVATSVEPAWRSVGENVGTGFSTQQLHDAFMGSTAHRANIMSGRFNRVGIGVVHAGGKTWVTVRFLEGPAISGTTGLDPVLEPLPPTPIRGIENACPAGTTLTSFLDLLGNTHAKSVGCVVYWAVASGRTPTTFEPDAAITRQQVATFIAQMLESSGVSLPSNPPDAFADDDHSIHQLRINQLAALGVVQGKTATSYRPAALVSRGEMATILVRAHREVTGKTLADGVNRFRDDAGSVHEVNINRVATAGIAAGNTASTFAPKNPVTRGQMSTFVSRTLDLLVDTGAVAPR